MKKASRSHAPAYDVVTIGAATRDVFARSSHFDVKKDASAPDGLDACLPLGAKIALDELLFETGGGATNAAVTFARWGFSTACVSRVGRDANGADLVAELAREGVDTRGIQIDPKSPTAYSVILLSGTGHRAILTARGASRNLDAAKIPWSALPSRWLYLTSFGGNPRLLTSVFATAKREHRQIAWNPGNAELDTGFKKLLPFLMQTGILLMNREEAAHLADCSPRQLDRIVKKLGSLPRKALVITDGAHGSYAHARGTTWHADAYPGKRINTTGAGDAFGSAFTASVMTDGDIMAALRSATLNSFGVITHMGAKAGILASAPTPRMCTRVRVRELR